MSNLKLFTGEEDTPVRQTKKVQEAGLYVVAPLIVGAFLLTGLHYSRPIKQWISKQWDGQAVQPAAQEKAVSQPQSTPSRPKEVVGLPLEQKRY